MDAVLSKYLPSHAVDAAFMLIKNNNVHLKIVNERKTRHGDYRRRPNGVHQITVNASLNKYRFLITLIHEIAHLIAFEKFGRTIKPHGKEWKLVFRNLMLPFINPQVFPEKLLPVIANHFKNPKASSDTDANLSVALKSFDERTGKNYVFELPFGAIFQIYNGKIFKRGEKRIKRYECVEVSSGKRYLFQPNAEVTYLSD
ncbi:SprT-like domain-containing protein [Zunongwangia sp.]|uniref:SprT-like domain-containing protein n=1 Tax=Zunongwangia sp. TaxID=1965325 RepID=UPI003AA8B17B